MYMTPSLEQTARELYDQEWDRRCRRSPQIAAEQSPLQVCPVTWLLRDLLPLVAESHDRPVSQIKPMIRDMILEKNFLDDTGDACMDEQRRAVLDMQVDLLVSVLEKVRRRALYEGEWSEVPAAPQMFG